MLRTLECYNILYDSDGTCADDCLSCSSSGTESCSANICICKIDWTGTRCEQHLGVLSLKQTSPGISTRYTDGSNLNYYVKYSLIHYIQTPGSVKQSFKYNEVFNQPSPFIDIVDNCKVDGLSSIDDSSFTIFRISDGHSINPLIGSQINFQTTPEWDSKHSSVTIICDYYRYVSDPIEPNGTNEFVYATSSPTIVTSIFIRNDGATIQKRVLNFNIFPKFVPTPKLILNKPDFNSGLQFTGSFSDQALPNLDLDFTAHFKTQPFTPNSNPSLGSQYLFDPNGIGALNTDLPILNWIVDLTIINCGQAPGQPMQATLPFTPSSWKFDSVLFSITIAYLETIVEDKLASCRIQSDTYLVDSSGLSNPNDAKRTTHLLPIWSTNGLNNDFIGLVTSKSTPQTPHYDFLDVPQNEASETVPENTKFILHFCYQKPIIPPTGYTLKYSIILWHLDANDINSDDPVITTSTSPKNEITYLPQRCPVGTYGDKCQLTNTIEETSMTASPTTLSAQSHSHIQWEYLGDNTQELTLVLQANKEKTGSGYFVWSQLLGTVPVASLYASAQIPTIDESKLFQYIYDAIASDNTAFTSIYNTQTDIIVRGYFTRAANLTIDLDTTQLPAGSFKFELPMLCNDFDVQCRQPISQFCHQSDGRCRCGPGYYDADPTKERTPDYVVELVDRIDASTGATISEQMNFDGDDLQCLPICKNGGTWAVATQLCECAPGFSGVNCEVKDGCDHSAMCSQTNGYLPFTTTVADDGSSIDECSSDCTCYGQWVDSGALIPAPSTPPTTETEPLPQCSICALKPLSSQFYNQTTISQLQTLLDQYESNPSLAIYGTQDEKYTQTYQPAAPITTDTETNPLTQQRCYVTGTDPVTFDKGNCSKCLCRKGYGGDYCQLHVAYASITYTPGMNNKYTYDTMTEVLLFDKIAEELSLSMNNFDKNDLFIVEHDTKKHLIRVGFYTGLDFFTRNAQLAEDATAIDNNDATNPMEMTSSLTNQRNLMSVLQANKYNFDIWNQPPTNYNPQLPTNLDNLYTQWGDLTQTAPTKPITNQDTDSFLGGVNIETGIDDTSCVEQSLLGCFGAETKRASSTALIIGLVVGLVCATLLLLVLILVLRWCKKNNRGFWKSKEDQDRDEMSNFVPTKRKEFTGSTAAPTVTVGTLSIMPAGMNDGVEMTKTGGASATSPASSVQSVNNHTEVKDPTLPAGYKAYKDAKGHVFYINSETMTTSWTHPNEVNINTTASGDAGYGSDW